jgi:hypothetical protein
MYVTCWIGGGVGNRLFQIAAMLGYAERYGHTPVFVKEWIDPISNPKQLGGNRVLTFFPDIRTIGRGDLEWTEIKEPHSLAMTYSEMPRIMGHVKLNGFFQSEKYFPTGDIRLRGLVSKPKGYPTYFLHVRRGDYLLPANAHHKIDLADYYRRAIELFPKDAYVLVCSDDIEWCKATLPAQYSRVRADKWLWLPAETNEYDTFQHMMGCVLGGICANSTFSWWGAYLNRGRDALITMPAQWMDPRHGIPTTDIYPAWAYVL